MLPRWLTPPLVLLLACAGCGSSGDTYFARGSQRSAGAYAFDGTEDGAWSYRYPDGQLRERGSWDQGKRVGTWTQWYPSGQRHSTGERRWDAAFRGSPREGPWTFWYANGELRARGSFTDGRAAGEWRWWNHLGELDARRSGVYVDGERVGELPG